MSTDPNIIAETIRKYFDVQPRPLNRTIYRKSYPEWIEKIMPLPREFEVSNFTIFSGEDEKFAIEHISRFTTQCGKANQNEYHKLRLFPFSLTVIAFIWYSFLPPNSMQNWANMEWLFHDRFY